MNDFEERVRRGLREVARSADVGHPPTGRPRRHLARTAVLLSAAAAVLAILVPIGALAFIDRSEPPASSQTPTPATGPTSPPSAPPSDSPTATPTATVSVPVTGKPGALVYDMSGTGGAGFVSPSGNIWCAIFTKKSGLVDSLSVRCDVQQWDYTPPPKPKGCLTDYGFAVALDPRAHFLCAGDTIADYVSLHDRFGAPYLVWFDPEQNPTVPYNKAQLAGLAYGNSIKVDQVICTSTLAGVDCRNTKTGTGFLIARSSYRLTP